MSTVAASSVEAALIKAENHFCLNLHEVLNKIILSQSTPASLCAMCFDMESPAHEIFFSSREKNDHHGNF